VLKGTAASMEAAPDDVHPHAVARGSGFSFAGFVENRTR
jgi:hypothetical protein